MLATPTPGWSNVPVAPSSVTLSAATVADNQAAGIVVGTLSATDSIPSTPLSSACYRYR